MILTLDLGNSRLSAGLFTGPRGPVRWDHATAELGGPQALAKAWRRELRRVGGPRAKVAEVAICSVVPKAEAEVLEAAVLVAGEAVRQLEIATLGDWEIGYDHPRELGPDRMAAAWGARARHPDCDLVVVDCGTATTVTVIQEGRRLLGGAILVGWGTGLRALSSQTGRLPEVAPEPAGRVVGRSTAEALRAGAWYGQIGALREVLTAAIREAFPGRRPRVLATGGHAQALAAAGLFDEVCPDLVLEGLRAWLITHQKREH